MNKITQLIKQTDDIQFVGIYREFLSFRRRHFVEYFLLKKIPFIQNLMECIEEEMNRREEIEEIANERTEEMIPEENEEDSKWKSEWKKQNELENSSNIKNDFKKILLYVAAFHICIFSFFIAQNLFKEKDVQKERMENLQETMYPNPQNKGPLSNAIGKRN
jgi:hypothetical protein